MTKDLKEKAIKIKGKDYVQVADRIRYFNDEFTNGCIKTSLVSEIGADMVIVKAQVIPDMENPDRYFTGYSQAVWGDGYINKTSALENAETSAVGRALALMGIGVLNSVASVDEVKKATSDIRNNARDNWAFTTAGKNPENNYCEVHKSFWGAKYPQCLKYVPGGTECSEGQVSSGQKSFNDNMDL